MPLYERYGKQITCESTGVALKTQSLASFTVIDFEPFMNRCTGRLLSMETLDIPENRPYSDFRCKK